MTAASPARALYRFHPKQQFAFDLIWRGGIEQMLYGGAAGGAKLLALDTPVPTPSGWTTMGALQHGDLVFDERGNVVRVLQAHAPQIPERAYRVIFDDGEVIEAGGEHLWLTYDAKELASLTRRDPAWRERRRASRPSRVTGLRSEQFTAAVTARNRLLPPSTLPVPTGTVRSTDEIVASLHTHTGRANHAIPIAQPLDLPSADLPLDPYLLGLWLGDGSRHTGAMTTMDTEIQAAFIACGFVLGKMRTKPHNRAWQFTVLGLVQCLRAAGVLHDKHVPAVYLRGSREQRLALLQGLMDTDGTSSPTSGAPSFTNTNRGLVDAVHEIIVSLGWKANIREGRAKFNGRDYGPVWTIKWTPNEYVFRLSRKRAAQALAQRRTTKFRYIVGVEPIEPKVMRCITVDSPTHLYLAGRAMVPTHNSHFVRGLAAYLAVLWPGSTVGIFRRTDAELQSNHVNPWLEEVDPFVTGGRFFQQKMEYHWPSPAWCWCPKGEPCAHSSRTAFRHIDDNRGARKYQGAEFAAELLDEATHFRGPDIDYLYTRVRANEDDRESHEIIGPTGRPYTTPGWPGWRRLQVLTANPGDVGMQYMLDNYIDPVEGMKSMTARDDGDMLLVPRAITDGPVPVAHPEMGTQVWDEPVGQDGYLRVDVRGGQQWTVEIDLGPAYGKVEVHRAFVPARLQDNPSLDPTDYAATLAVGSSENRRRLLDGDWTFSEDRLFKVLSRDVHLVDGRRIFGRNQLDEMRPPPVDYLRGIGLDDGTAKPTAAIWVCLEDEGFYVAYREYYSPGPTGQHVRAIKEGMEWDGHTDLRIQADPRMWHQVAGVEQTISRAAIYEHLGEPPLDPGERRAAYARGIRLSQSKIEDKAALMGLEEMLEPSPERMFPGWHPRSGQYGAPMLFIAEQCPSLWRELVALRRPALEHDGMYGEGIKNGQADHAFDALKRIVTPLRHASIAINTRPAGGPRRILEAARGR